MNVVAPPSYACRCGCGLNKPSPALIKSMMRLNTILRWKWPYLREEIISGCRCLNHHRNTYEDMGWEDSKIPWKSYHLPDDKGYCKGADVRFKSGRTIIPPLEIAYIIQHHSNFLHATFFQGIGAMTTSLHLDVRPHPKHWIRKDGRYVYDVDFKELIVAERGG